MCFYHAYAHRCGHTEMIFMQMCVAAQMTQRKCPRGQEGVILTTVKVEHPCSGCPKKVRWIST
ncbi:hypothetical protein P171DRAFT_354549 [Karstenula rhodostoma CBS 690.94]|uniref:Uncharacterized protein n=1 Tax=Karstenula rhodostoma CBS 690.94 TaxID=1392251 RepID=A0A9P4UEJ9_9PLEO|nr:hypothetical protein P171DRAFT_354549 [Karstenula rhodostoma CBS 690.94]